MMAAGHLESDARGGLEGTAEDPRQGGWTPSPSQQQPVPTDVGVDTAHYGAGESAPLVYFP